MPASEQPPVLRNAHSGWSKCRACKTDIVFAIMYSSGKNSPFEQDAAGEWVIENGVAKHDPIAPAPAQTDLFAVPPAPSSAMRWTSHFARCPASEHFRKR